jgi:hypothetical protein
MRGVAVHAAESDDCQLSTRKLDATYLNFLRGGSSGQVDRRIESQELLDGVPGELWSGAESLGLVGMTKQRQ